MERGTVELWIEDHSGPLSVDALIQFLIHFRAAYAVAAGHPGNESVDPLVTGTIVADVIRRMEITFRQVTLLKAAGAELNAAERLDFLDVSRENPVRFVLSGSVLAIAAAVSFAGGRIEMGGGKFNFKASTPGLVQAVLNIQQAFGTAGIAANTEPQALPAPPVQLEAPQKVSKASPRRRPITIKRPPSS
jgi:hypothetical protein